MVSTWLGLYTATRGLQAAQRGLDVTGHNITNANTPGFSRQRATLVAAPALAYPGFNPIPGQLGQGVDVQSILRLRDEFLDDVWRRQRSALSTVESQSLAYMQLEGMLNEPSETGIGRQLTEFFQGWNTVANTPESRPARTQLRENTLSLLRTFRTTAEQIARLRRDQDTQITMRIGEANRLIDQVADLNKQIAAISASGQQANDLMDRRDLLVDELSKIVPVQAIPSGRNQVDVQLGGVKLVSQTRGIHLETYVDPMDPSQRMQLRAIEARTIVPLGAGELSGYLTMRDQTLPAIERRLNELVSTLVNRVNQLHRKHYGLDGIAGRPFFNDIITQTRTGTIDLGAAFPSVSINANTRLGELGITAGEFQLQGRVLQISAADVDPNTGITLGQLFTRINEGQSQVQVRLSDTFTGQRVVLELFNPPDRQTVIEPLNGTSNLWQVLGLTGSGAANIDTAQRQNYRGAMVEASLYLPLLEDTGLIAAAGELVPGEFGGPGDNQGALMMSELEDRLDLFLEGGSLSGFYNATISLLGSMAQGNQRAVLNQTALTDQADQLRQSISGVSLDEEAVELIKFQKAFEASARVITTLQGIYDTILGLIR